MWTLILYRYIHRVLSHIFMHPLKKGGYCFATVGRSVGRSVCRPSVVRLIIFWPLYLINAKLGEGGCPQWVDDPYWFSGHMFKGQGQTTLLSCVVHFIYFNPLLTCFGQVKINQNFAPWGAYMFFWNISCLLLYTAPHKSIHITISTLNDWSFNYDDGSNTLFSIFLFFTHTRCTQYDPFHFSLQISKGESRFLQGGKDHISKEKASFPWVWKGQNQQTNVWMYFCKALFRVTAFY